MKIRPILLSVLAGALGIAALGTFTTPLNRAFLQSNLNGGGYAGTNFGIIRSTNFIDAATGLPLSFGGSSTNFGVVAGTGLTASTQSSAGLTIVTLSDVFSKQRAHPSLTNVTALASNNYVGTFTGNVAGATNLPFGALSATAATAVTNSALAGINTASNSITANITNLVAGTSNSITANLTNLVIGKAAGLTNLITAVSNALYLPVQQTGMRTNSFTIWNNAGEDGAQNVKLSEAPLPFTDQDDVPVFTIGNVASGGVSATKFTGDGSGLTNVPYASLSASGQAVLTNFVAGRSTNFTAYAAGTAYSLTATPEALDFGTTDPAMTLFNAGTYLIRAKVGVKFNGSTYGTTQTATLKLRRTNNTAADLPNGSRAVTMPILTTFTGGSVFDLPEIVYTATAGDQITVFGSVSATPSAGSVDTDSAEIVAQRIY